MNPTEITGLYFAFPRPQWSTSTTVLTVVIVLHAKEERP